MSDFTLPYADEGRRLRLLRQAEGFPSGLAFAAWMGWAPAAISLFECGRRRVPVEKLVELREKVPGFCPVWLWEGDAQNLCFNLRKRIEAEEARELLIAKRLGATS
jgi:hypothetical protein